MLPGFLQRSGVDASFPELASSNAADIRSESQWVKTCVLLLQDPSKHHIHSDEEDLEVKRKTNFLKAICLRKPGLTIFFEREVDINNV